MSATEIDVRPFDPDRAVEADLVGYHRVMLASQGVERPDEAPLTYENMVGRLRNPFPGFGPVAYWVARLDGEVVGVAFSYFPEAENGHLGLTDVTVHPGRRRRGVGTALLRTVLGELRNRGRTTVEGWQVTQGGAGQLWAEALGFRIVNTTLMQTLTVPGTDRGLWQVDGPAGYRVQQWEGAAPAELVVSYAAARGAIHDAPVGELGFRAPEWTAERVRETEADLRGRDVTQRVVVAVHEGTGQVAGLTEVELQPHRPYWVYQRDTAVLPGHRGRGLGRCLKAHMMRWLLADRPDLTLVYTTTSADNTHMIRVNHQLGYVTVRTMVAVNRALAGLDTDLDLRSVPRP